MTGGAARRDARRGHRGRVAALIRLHRWRVALLAAASYLGGTSEALFLLLAARTGLAASSDQASLALWGATTVRLGTAIALAAGLLALRLAANVAVVALSTGLTRTVLVETRSRLATAFFNASWSLQQAEPSGSLQTLSGYVDVAVRVVTALSSSIAAGLGLVSMLAVATTVDPLATGVIVVSLGLLSRLMIPLRRRIRRRSTTDNRASSTYNQALAELSGLGLELQTFGVRERAGERIASLAAQHAAAYRRTTALQGLLTPAYTSMAYAGVIGGLAAFSIGGSSRINEIGPVMLLMLRSLAYGQQLQTGAGTLTASLPPLERVEEATRRYEAARAAGGITGLDHIESIDATNVSYTYADDQQVLTDVSFSLRPGEVVGIIGPSGAGKSTLMQLLLGLREATAGRITVNGVGLDAVDRRSWAARVAFVSQEPRLVTGTVAENIRFFRDGISDAQIESAAERANLRTEIDRMAEGFGSFLGERATMLSGGQRQRLAIARALAGSPEVLFLDEPTSALDARSEELIRSTIDGLRGKVLTVVIAHRMSTIEVCDRILVIEGGRLTAVGSPAELAERSAFYRHALDVAAP